MKKMTLNEIMGNKGSDAKEKKLSVDDLGELLGERLPKLDPTPVGRLRLITALKNRFGKNYRTLPGIDDVIKEFDENIKFNIRLQEIKMIKGRK